MQYLSLYMGEVTRGGTDGTAVSTDMAQTSPLTVFLNAGKNNDSVMKLGLRCIDNFQTIGETVVSFMRWNEDLGEYETTGKNLDRWQIALDEGFASADIARENAAWTNSIVISDAICNRNYVIWVKVSAKETDEPMLDQNVSIHADAEITMIIE